MTNEHPIDWTEPSSHVSGLAVGTERTIWRKGQPQLARLHRIVPNGEEWRIHTPSKWRQGEWNYVYSEGWRYVVEHTMVKAQF